ncbi:MAG: hemolysin III family protein, partial [Bacteroidota bacterium]
EERWNIRTHGFGILASILGSFFLIQKANTSFELLASIIFGSSLIILYLASTLYHAATDEEKRTKLRIFDHAAIFILIAGTYTPICMISLQKSWGVPLLIVTWSIAILGIMLKLFFTGKYDRASTILYVGMGWIAIVAIKPLLEAFPIEPLLWLLAGGICYTTGAVIYSFRKIPFNHAIFHVFVLGGSLCHYIMIYRYVI